jgi:hypothetical protein
MDRVQRASGEKAKGAPEEVASAMKKRAVYGNKGIRSVAKCRRIELYLRSCEEDGGEGGWRGVDGELEATGEVEGTGRWWSGCLRCDGGVQLAPDTSSESDRGELPRISPSLYPSFSRQCLRRVRNWRKFASNLNAGADP